MRLASAPPPGQIFEQEDDDALALKANQGTVDDDVVESTNTCTCWGFHKFGAERSGC